ncbi:WxL domain-containing protein [Enterococcus sp.]|uniref:WxL domain-containing protein n=1 Tax=Enterococcus sp. TaxID=35783 RepID=UPI0028A2BEF0|nr:WxL domain-containing protein [Enterococcus sp.]
MNRWFNKCVVHLMLALVNFPIWYQPIAILNAQPVEITEEEFTTAEELKQSNEQLILPDMTDVDKQEPIFSFEKEVLQGEVDETLLLTFFSDQTVGDISLKIPEAVKINENDLDANMAIYSRDTDQEWLLSTSKKQKQFTIPLSVDKPGSYSVVVANQAEVTLKISGEEPQDEEMLTNEAEIEVTDGQVYEDNIRSDQLRNNVGIRDFELTGIVDNEDDFHLVPIGTVPLRVSDQTQVYYNGQLQTGLFDIQQAQLGNAEIRITNLGSYRGESVEVIFDKFNTNGPLSSLRVHQSNDNIQWQIIRNNNQEEAAISMNQTTRIMETKEIIGSPVIQGMMQYFQNNSFFQIKQSALHSVLLLDTYDGDVTVRSINSDFEFNMGTGTLTTLDPNKMSSFIVDSDVEFKFSFPEQAVLSYGIALFGWPGEELFPLYNINTEASPAIGGNPIIDTASLWQGSTTEIRANPATGYTFSRWEIVSGTGSSIANVNAANTTFTMGSSNTTIRAVYTQNTYNLTVQASPAAGGNPTVGSGTVAQGSTTEIRANPATGYTFSRWEIVSGTGSSIANVNAANTTFTMGSSNTTIRAVYTQNTYSVTVVPVPSDGGRPSASREVFDLTNHMIYFDAAPSEGYRFVKYELIEGSTSMWWDPYDDMPIIVFDLSDVIMHVHYEKISAAEVEVNYIDLDQNKIASSVILTGALGDNYETEPKDIEGYLLVETPENANGIFTENNQTVEYVYDTEKVTPVDPVKPEEKVDPDDKPLITENQGLLSIDFVSQFRFSEQVISVDDAIYYAHSQKLLNEDGQIREEIRPNYVQISDRRVQDDSDVGWSLSLVQKEQFQTTYGQELLGARLILSDQQLDTATNNLAPTILEEEDLELVPGVKQTLVSAQKGQGKGTWIYRFGDEDTAENSVRLVIPAKTMPKATTYTSTLVWELSMVPAVPVENR